MEATAGRSTSLLEGEVALGLGAAAGRMPGVRAATAILRPADTARLAEAEPVLHLRREIAESTPPAGSGNRPALWAEDASDDHGRTRRKAVSLVDGVPTLEASASRRGGLAGAAQLEDESGLRGTAWPEPAAPSVPTYRLEARSGLVAGPHQARGRCPAPRDGAPCHAISWFIDVDTGPRFEHTFFSGNTLAEAPAHTHGTLAPALFGYR